MSYDKTELGGIEKQNCTQVHKDNNFGERKTERVILLVLKRKNDDRSDDPSTI